jgi:hypothetical protein
LPRENGIDNRADEIRQRPGPGKFARAEFLHAVL